MDGIKKCLILAGGLGTRLKSVSGDIPKPMMPIGNRSFLEIILENLKKQNITEIYISISYNPEYFLNYFKDTDYKFIIENEALGTGGAIKYALEQIGDFEDILCLNGDTLFDINFQELYLKHKLTSSDITIGATIIEKPYRYGTLEIAQNRVNKFIEKREIESGLINCGVYLLNKNIINYFPDKAKFSFESDFLELNTDKIKIAPYISDSYFIDIGIPEDYEKAVEKYA